MELLQADRRGEFPPHFPHLGEMARTPADPELVINLARAEEPSW